MRAITWYSESFDTPCNYVIATPECSTVATFHASSLCCPSQATTPFRQLLTPTKTHLERDLIHHTLVGMLNRWFLYKLEVNISGRGSGPRSPHLRAPFRYDFCVWKWVMSLKKRGAGFRPKFTSYLPAPCVARPASLIQTEVRVRRTVVAALQWNRACLLRLHAQAPSTRPTMGRSEAASPCNFIWWHILNRCALA